MYDNAPQRKRSPSANDQRLVTPECMPPADRTDPHNHEELTDDELLELCKPPEAGKPYVFIGKKGQCPPPGRAQPLEL